MTVLLISGAILTASPSLAAAKGSNSDAAKKCQKGGWQEWVRADRTPFKNQGDCVSYAARGGTLTSKESPVEVACTGGGGTFANAPAVDVIWSCSVPALSDAMYFALGDLCANEPGSDGLGIILGGIDDWRYVCWAQT